MHIQIIGFAVEEHAMDEARTLCAECAAACNRITAVQAHQWSYNLVTNTVSGMMKWTEPEAIAMGTESLCTEVARLYCANRILPCKENACSTTHPPARRDTDERPNTGFVQHPPDYDPRG
jgi:hypothetical protein